MFMVLWELDISFCFKCLWLYFGSSFISISSITECWNSVSFLSPFDKPNLLGSSSLHSGKLNAKREKTEFHHSVILDIDIKEESKYNHKHLNLIWHKSQTSTTKSVIYPKLFYTYISMKMETRNKEMKNMNVKKKPWKLECLWGTRKFKVRRGM